jgi:hypothetical protein
VGVISPRTPSSAAWSRSSSGPNICTVYDVDEHEGRPFIAMELLERQTLQHRFASKPMKLDELDLGIRIRRPAGSRARQGHRTSRHQAGEYFLKFDY